MDATGAGPRLAVVALAILEPGWLAFDGGRALIVGDYVTNRMGTALTGDPRDVALRDAIESVL
jgi:hypothetical protein